eukprot:TRINITY_DN7553_c0_g2_i12.p1 TRINITY_DN7553_c0_g2~~TRINITY_DN7553_c0_g2_i12.p1  ORF type:complete len:236 (+),score=46.93 TRINITY_DN7553_c0_g2_i12:598-1305(+)
MQFKQRKRPSSTTTTPSKVAGGLNTPTPKRRPLTSSTSNSTSSSSNASFATQSPHDAPGLTTRDLLILSACAFVVLISFTQSGNWNIKPAFIFSLDSSLYENGHFPKPEERAPPPIITDLDGDGINEIILVTKEPSLIILDTQRLMGAEQQGLQALQSLPIKHQVSLIPSVRVAMGKQAVALTTGYIEPYNTDEVRTQVIVVVTDGWKVLCFDHKLNLLWENSISEHFSSRAFYA